MMIHLQDLTLTNVVFELFWLPSAGFSTLNLTLTNVVFEFK